jgi:DNA helicase IV
MVRRLLFRVVPPMAHPDLAFEQAHLDRAYERLEYLRAETEKRLAEAFKERGGTFQSYTERDIRVRIALTRLERLFVGREALVFGRIDRRDGEGEGEGEGGSFHIGRLAISDADHEPLVVDWRAPVAEPFYRATGAHPMGLRRRRHFLTEGRRVADLEDELFVVEGETPEESTAAPGLAGPAVLMAALERAHTGRMRDIVATVQAEQDEVIRAPLAGLLVVQGGPGTGKTAVALHRAAYLLYTHRFPLETQGVLVVGPNPTFLRYIDQVLPSLGETGVEMSTATGLYVGTSPSAEESPEVAHLKGDPRMAKFLRRALRQRERPLRKAVRVPFGGVQLILSPKASGEIVSSVKARPGAHNARRLAVETMLWQHFANQVNRRDVPVGELGAELRARPEIQEALHRMWPRLTPEEFLRDLFGAPPLIELAGRGLLSPEEQAMLYRPRGASPKEVGWTSADIALLDESSALLGPFRSRPAQGQLRRTYGHVIVDEVQDLTPMQLRMVARRSLSASMTIVGDLAQATGPWAPASWEEVVTHLPTRRGWRSASLSVNYRAPAEVMAVASRVLTAALPGAVAPDAVRQTGHLPRFLVPAHSTDEAWDRLLSTTVREELEAVAGTGGAEGTVGVLTSAGQLGQVEAALATAGIDYGQVGARALDTSVNVLALRDAKGLEFDSVVVVEPAQIAAEPPEGLRALYVALTRCTRRLAIVHREPLPPALADAENSARAHVSTLRAPG